MKNELNIPLLSYNGKIKKDLLDPEKLEATLGDESLAKGSDLKKALEMVALFEAQMKEMNPIQNYQWMRGLNLRQVQLLHQRQKQLAGYKECSRRCLGSVYLGDKEE
ncbi:hypothetical protein Tco_1009017 [Tanacetum coccineum]